MWCPKTGPGCAWDGGQCICPGLDNPTGSEVTQPTQEPGEVWCPKNPGCQWNGETCLYEKEHLPIAVYFNKF